MHQSSSDFGLRGSGDYVIPNDGGRRANVRPCLLTADHLDMQVLEGDESWSSLTGGRLRRPNYHKSHS